MNNLTPVSKEVYTNFYNELEVKVDGVDKNKIMEQERECLFHLAKAKTGLKTVTLNICWNINGKYFTETVTG